MCVFLKESSYIFRTVLGDTVRVITILAFRERRSLLGD